MYSKIIKNLAVMTRFCYKFLILFTTYNQCFSWLISLYRMMDSFWLKEELMDNQRT